MGRGRRGTVSQTFSSVSPAMFKPGEGEESVDSPAPCPESYQHFCEHGKCEMRHNMATCRYAAPPPPPLCPSVRASTRVLLVPHPPDDAAWARWSGAA